ncbi:Myb-like DNA-binding domain protein [Mortierella polycephala]|uniref:Myb-like DNA-binding domain protein n=1 Tax=Mortierella polycephala TaxID=41804 RepID=A0A9P6TYL6_9FUNG|nr:Myb-like DNA-binding domain protein [Mortierella polycephala]
MSSPLGHSPDRDAAEDTLHMSEADPAEDEQYGNSRLEVMDLLTDESDNDEVDNEADLASLLRAHNVSIDKPHPLSDNTHESSDDYTKGKIVPSMAAPTPIDVQESETPDTTTSTPSESYTAPSVSSKDNTKEPPAATPGAVSNNVLTEPSSSSSSSRSSSWEPLRPREAQAQESSPTVGTSMVPEQNLTPFVLSDEERIRLTRDIRTRTSTALGINRECQEALRRHLLEVEKAYNRNKEMRDQLRELIEEQERVRRAPVLLPATKARIGPPYFVDQDSETPPDNQDTVKRKKTSNIIGKSRRWTEQERDSLKHGVISENKRILFDFFSRTGDVAGIAYLDRAPEIQMMLNTKQLNWTRISQRFVDTRTPTECLIQWTGHDHPGINKKEWTKVEVSKLEELAKKHQERNWIQIALDLDTNRTGAQCFRKYQSKPSRTGPRDIWTEEEDNILTEAVRRLGERNWQQISYYLEGRTPGQCMSHWTKSLDPRIRRGRWLEEEDGAIRAAVKVYGEGRWTRIQEHVLGRTDIQCRERYVNILAPTLKSGVWTKEELDKLEALINEHGERKWAFVATFMDGRTDSQCARRWKMLCQERERIAQGKVAAAYLSTNRRKNGRTTLAQLPDPQVHKLAIRKAATKIRHEQKRLENKKKKTEDAREVVINEQERELRKDYDTFTERQRYIYDVWDQRWGKYVDPVEKVFNLGIPPNLLYGADDDSDEDAPSVVNQAVPDPLAATWPGKVRPVPPCFATMDAFSKLLLEGQHDEGRFKLKGSQDSGIVGANTLKTEVLSLEEQRQTEYVELAERFESVFMWPMMMGMLNMETARDLVKVPEPVSIPQTGSAATTNGRKRRRTIQPTSSTSSRSRRRRTSTAAAADGSET